MGKDTYYFPHDYNARNDDSTAALIAEHGATGYGVYWIIAEMLHEDESSKIEYTEKKLRRIAGPAKVEYEQFKKIVDDCIDAYDLFYNEDGFIVSDRVMKNKEKRDRIKEIRREIGSRGGKKSQAIAKQLVEKSDQLVEQNQAKPTKGKESKGNSINTISKEELMNKRSIAFGLSLEPYKEIYGKDMLTAFFRYWKEPNKSKSKMKWEGEKTWDLEGRLRRWHENSTKFDKQPKQQKAEHTGQPLRNAADMLREQELRKQKNG